MSVRFRVRLPEIERLAASVSVFRSQQLLAYYFYFFFCCHPVSDTHSQPPNNIHATYARREVRPEESAIRRSMRQAAYRRGIGSSTQTSCTRLKLYRLLCARAQRNDHRRRKGLNDENQLSPASWEKCFSLDIPSPRT